MHRVLLLLLVGCDAVWGLSEVPAPDGSVIGNYDHCGPQASDPLRYATIASAMAWDDARVACKRRGMDLAVINDPHELASADLEIRPSWLGAQWNGQAWTGVDGCAVADVPGADPSRACGIVDGDGAETGVACTGDLGDGARVTSALCETPRSLTGNCGLVAPQAETYEVSAEAFTYAQARAYCEARGAHLVVVDSQAELAHLSKLADGGALPRVWIGATFDRTGWQSDTPACPGLYVWADGGPVFGVSTDCLATAMLDDAEGVRLAGMRPTRCLEPEIHALCESRDRL